ncbi:hypothetical protein Mapa_002708 [Marchantia paleacea]|nr:hypothetical protein Mapa_002708 [Marchantia paleacea]
MGYFKLPALFVIASILCRLSSSSVYASSISKYRTLVKYEFEGLVSPNISSVVAASPSGSGNSSANTGEFGTIRVVKNIVRESNHTDSEVLGQVVGLVNSLGDGLVFLSLDFMMNNSRWNGTLGVQGVLDQNQGELEVVGGTNSFRFAKGYCTTTLEYSDSSFTVYKHTFRVKF